MILTFEKALEDLRAVVAERGEDYTYPARDEGCVYFTPTDDNFDWESTNDPDWRPSCIVGCVVDREGLKHRLLDKGLNNDTPVEGLFGSVLQPEDLRTERLLQVAQWRQDRSAPYGEVLYQAELAAYHAGLPEQGFRQDDPGFAPPSLKV